MKDAIAFDTHRFVKRLSESGFTEKQAETLAAEHVALLDADLATKADLAAVKADLLKWLIGALVDTECSPRFQNDALPALRVSSSPGVPARTAATGRCSPARCTAFRSRPSIPGMVVGLAAAETRRNMEQRPLDFRAVSHVGRRPSGPGPEGVARKRICHGAFIMRSFASARCGLRAHRSFT